MDYVQKVRADYSISQAALARFLGVKRSLLSMNELGKRKFVKTNFIVRLDALIDTHAEVEREFQTEESLQFELADSQRLIDQIVKALRMLQRQLEKEEEKLNALNEQLIHAQKAHIALKKIQASADLFLFQSSERDWLSEQIHFQEQKIRKAPFLKMILAKAQIASIREEIRLLSIELNSIK
jgi:transcriptional regulator with XRE-family HTH domain